MYWCLCVLCADACHPFCPQIHVTHKCVLTAACVGCHETRPSPPHEAQAAFLPTGPQAPVARKMSVGRSATQRRRNLGKEKEKLGTYMVNYWLLWEPECDGEIWLTERGVMSIQSRSYHCFYVNKHSIIIKCNASEKSEMLTLPTCPFLPASPIISQSVAHKAVFLRGSFFFLYNTHSKCTFYYLVDIVHPRLI